jgi:PGF-CTERM protein
MKTKIIGIALATIMIASIFGALLPMGSAAGLYNDIARQAGSQKVLIGEDLNLTACNAVVGAGHVSISRIDSGEVKEVYYADSNDKFDTAVLTTTGTYYVNWDSTDATIVVTVDSTVHNASAQLAVSTATATLALKATSANVTKEVTTITQGTSLITAFTTNLFGDDVVDLIITGPDGRMHSDASYKDPVSLPNQSFDALTVTTLQGGFGSTAGGIDTRNWKVGTYTFQIKTKSEQSRGLDAATAVKTLTIGKPEISITADKTSVVEIAPVKLTVTGKVDNTIQISGPAGNTHVIFPSGTEDNKPYTTGTGLMDTLKIDADGTRIFSVYFDATGSYTIKVSDQTAVVSDTVDITVSERQVTFDMPVTVIIGDKVTIRGTANTGTSVDVYIDGVLFDKLDNLVLSNGEFSKEITADANVGMGVPGTVRLKAWIDSTIVGSAVGVTTTPTTSEDGSVAILLQEPGLSAETDVKVVAQEDSFHVTGVAKGSTSVDVVSVAPKGSGGKGLSPGSVTGQNGLTLDSPSVSETDSTFSQKITVDADADTGVYYIVVTTKGRDGYYGTTDLASTRGNVVTAIATGYARSLTGKTQEQVLAIAEDVLVGAGSDDLMSLISIKVESARVTLDAVAGVGIGEPLAVSGTTNREEGHSMLMTAKGPTELTPVIAPVKADGTFNATFDTTGAKEGTYTVKVDDGDGHTDETTVNIGAAKPSPTATATPTATPATPTPTVPPTATPATPTPATPTPATPTPKTPGFEAVFAIAGLLAIAYLVLRIRK